MRFRTLLIIPAILMVSHTIRAQEAPAPTAEDRDKAALTQMKSDLRNLIVAQEAYFADHSAYAGVVGDLRYRSTENVSVRLTATQNNAWAGEARSALLPNVACVVWINLAEENRPKVGGKLIAAKQGQPACGLIEEKK